jgi:DegV family protein with EDD domain
MKMSEVGIVTESSGALPKDVVTEYAIRVVPLGYVHNNKVYRDDIDISIEDFWKIFPTFTEIPTTSAGSLGDFRNTFLDLSRNTRSIVCITMSKLLSATYNAAEQAARMVMEESPGLDIRVIDSKTGLGALGLTVIEAARAARAGKNADEVVGVAQNIMSRVKYFMVLESLKYIMKIGRAPDAKTQSPGIPAAVPQFSPILGIVKTGTGVLENLEKASNIDEALNKATEMVKDYIDINKPVHFLLDHPDNIEKCEQLKQALTRKYHCAEIFIGRMTPAMIVSCGPMFAIAFYT